MEIKGWTHPKHKYVAGIGLLVCSIVTALDMLNVFYFPWFVNKRTKGVSDADKNGYTFFSNSVDCSNDVCERKQSIADWQQVTFYLLLIGVGSSGLSLAVQLVLFWPLVLTGRVYNITLKLSRFSDFYGSPLKFAAAMIYVSHSGKINYNYSWSKGNPAILQLEPFVIGLLLMSYILQVLVYVALTVAVDVGPRGGPTYLDLIEEEQRELKDLEVDQSVASTRTSTYAPDTHGDHARILDTVKYSSEQDSYGTVV
ncbi:hypothetical protein BgiBS90_018388 [Biomphalaria glabrata]|nr:hypothetical protein BgiBS90_018388 [Biomphalaria glabrata]